MKEQAIQNTDLISVHEARIIMGDGAEEMSDEEVQEAIYNLTSIARQYIKLVPRHQVFT